MRRGGTGDVDASGASITFLGGMMSGPSSAPTSLALDAPGSAVLRSSPPGLWSHQKRGRESQGSSNRQSLLGPRRSTRRSAKNAKAPAELGKSRRRRGIQAISSRLLVVASFAFAFLCTYDTTWWSLRRDVGGRGRAGIIGAFANVCEHEEYETVDSNSTEIRDGQTIYRDIKKNQTHRFFYSNYNVTTMNQPDQYRKLIINLEPCTGVVYLFVRKTRRCWPNPYSCIDLTPGQERRRPQLCAWTHFMSVIDGSRDGAPTFFEAPLSSTTYFVSVFGARNGAYQITFLADIGAFPRPKQGGKITARQLQELQVQLSWDEATFKPMGISAVKQYWIYSAMLLQDDNRTNTAVFLRPTKIMNTVCGLQNNTDREYDKVPAAMCQYGRCNATIDGVITQKRYIFNVVAESERGFKMAYAGLIMRTDWQIVTQAASDKTLRVVGAVSGSVLGMVIIGYLWMIKLYG